MKTLRPLRSRVKHRGSRRQQPSGAPGESSKGKKPEPQGRSVPWRGCDFGSSRKRCVKPPFLFPGLSRFCFVCFVWFPSGSAEIIGCDVMRSKKFDVIAVDELDTMHLEADLTDAIVSADAASKNNKNATRSTCPLQLPWGKGCRTMGSSTPSRKGAVDDRGSRRRHETVAHFGHPRIGRPGFEDGNWSGLGSVRPCFWDP